MTDKFKIEDVLIGDYLELVLNNSPDLMFREKDPMVFHATDAGKCKRELCYKKLGTPTSNPTDMYGQMRMGFGNYTESGLKYQVFSNTYLFGLPLVKAQGDCGERDFYGTAWTGYRDFDFGLDTADGRIPLIVELKTKVGFGANMMIRETAYSKKFKTPELDMVWGYPQQLALYLRDGFKHGTERGFNNPVRHGRLVYYLYFDGGCGLVEFKAVYRPEDDSVLFYGVDSKQFAGKPPYGVEGPLNHVIYLKDIADKWKITQAYIERKELAPPDYERKYSITDKRVDAATKTDLTAAVAGKLLIGDMKCKYCSFKDKCASDLKIPLQYNADELSVLKNILKTR